MNKTPVLTVTQLNTYIKSLFDFDRNLNNVTVVGQISNFTNHYRTGHFYMTIKDEQSAIKAVMFRSTNQRLKFEPKNDMKVIVRGRVSVFERDGQYQLYIDDMQPDGVGELALAFEQLKEKLSKAGLFDRDRKKPIPQFPEKIGVVTSPTGAAVQDILNILSRRYPIADVILAPVQVQGSSAAPQIVKAINEFNDKNCADVLIVGRGGGSIEDLWAFNEESVALAIANSQIPVISAVGHETDVTISDFVADLRAPTPSAAAELATPDILNLRAFALNTGIRIEKYVRNEIENRKNYLNNLILTASLNRPTEFLNPQRQMLDLLSARCDVAVNGVLAENRKKVEILINKLSVVNPVEVLKRGYSVSYNNEKVISTIDDIKTGDNISIRFSDGTAECTVNSVRN